MNHEFHRYCMQEAIDQSRRSVSEPEKISPLVGAILAKGESIIGRAYRGMPPHVSGHAEFCLLNGLEEKGFQTENYFGSTLYTTLEPCTFRGRDKKSCADRIRASGISRVVVGMLDPNPYILGNGILILRQLNIEVELFPPDMMAEIENINNSFLHQYGWSKGEEIDSGTFPNLNNLCGKWIVEAPLPDGTIIVDEVYIQRRVANRLYGVQINLNAQIESLFYITYIDKGIVNYTFRSKSNSPNGLDHGTGMAVFKNDNEAIGYGASRGAVVGEIPQLLSFKIRRSEN